MHIRSGRDQCYDCEVHPLRRLLVERIERDKKREGPDGENDCRRDAAIDDLAEVTSEEERDATEDSRRNRQQIGLRCVEAKIA